MHRFFLSILLLATLLFSQDASYKRGADQTYLTYPEWFLVFSPEEYAYYLKDHPSYDFNYLGHLGQFWGSYEKMYAKTKEKHFEFNTGYHVMIMTIGVSTSVEYLIKYIYGHSVAEFFALTQSSQRVSEQEYGQKVAQEYVDFIKNRLWYEFDFVSKIRGIYTLNSFFGKDFLRKCERKSALTQEYTVKFLYAKIIGFFTEVGYEEALPTTRVELSKDNVLLDMDFPRYDKFKNESLKYARKGYSFKSIAGNDASSSILYSLVGEKKIIDTMPCMIQTPILSNKKYARCINDVKISELANVLNNKRLAVIDTFLPPKGIVKLEHIFDY
ncbi:hypothetical protein [Sulfurimonas paralvinellae]|uniref:Uncharacterized protein n=1 Tax=Sulfurimonas paralvinellae TaxID=317658 RepID=A0A7M1B9U2_9BACT|nr:hypothetical protein [Sulfurimonas paralvinellae]QOP46425.1 hypothetical protein FM071_09025 [Sulfurimonas paralvinellae]